MDITSLTLAEISAKLKHYVTIYFIDSSIHEDENGLFQECVTLHHSECCHLIPKEHQSRFKDVDTFNAASGYIRFKSKGYQFKGKEFVVMLLHTDTSALFLYLQEQDNATHADRDILLVDLTKQAQHQ